MRYIIIFLLISSSYLFYKAYNDALSKDVEFTSTELNIIKKDGGIIPIKIQIADTINERSKGLMFVKAMPENEGMLFVFDDEEARKMWMENTLIPLDMLFIDSKFQIFNYKENATPLSQEIIYSVGPTQYVLELNGGFIKRNQISFGDKIEIKN